MFTKEAYLKMKSSNQIDIESLYEMYLENKSPEKQTLSIEQFIHPMTIHLSLVGIDMEKYHAFFDKKFGLI